MITKKRYIISNQNTRLRPPITFTILVLLILDVKDADGWVIGVVGTILSILWFRYFYKLFTEDQVEVDLFAGIEPEKPVKASQAKWEQRLKEVQDAANKAKEAGIRRL